jgi:serine/threonine protein phosphatase 1
LRTIAIGDIHGCSVALNALLKHVAPKQEDQLIFLGDYVDRGPDSKAVIETLVELRSQCQCVFLLGNHEIVLLACLDQTCDLETWKSIGGQETLDSYGGIELIPQAHIDFFRTCLPYYETDKYFFVHANYDPITPLAELPAEILYWEHLGPSPPGPHINDKTAFCGHTPQLWGKIADYGHLVCIDTYCFGGGWLTALEVENRQIWQTNRRGRLRKQKQGWFSTISKMVKPRSDEKQDSEGMEEKEQNTDLFKGN